MRDEVGDPHQIEHGSVYSRETGEKKPPEKETRPERHDEHPSLDGEILQIFFADIRPVHSIPEKMMINVPKSITAAPKILLPKFGSP